MLLKLVDIDMTLGEVGLAEMRWPASTGCAVVWWLCKENAAASQV